MVNVAILGYGVVGSGVAQVLLHNKEQVEAKAGQPVAVKRVLDLRSFPGDPVEPLLTNDYNDILNDSDIQIVVEVMGGVEPALTYVKQALSKGKHVCTSNKELVSKYGAELLRLAKERNVNFLFEASVGGGIPIIRPMNMALTTDEVVAVSGILNGTSNYILTQMAAFGRDFDEALREAKDKGYAEKNPTADIEGFDACRKLAILLSLATGRHVDFEQIHTEGISKLEKEDFAFAKLLGFTIKLMVDGRITPGGVEAVTAPMLVHHSHPFYTVHDVFNGVLVQARMTDNVLLIGRGAGKLPTAGAVASDVVDAARHHDQHIAHSWSAEPIPVLPFGEYKMKKLMRMVCRDKGAAKKAVQDDFGMETIFFYELPEYPDQIAWFLPEEPEDETGERVARLSKGGSEIHMIRVYEPMELENHG